MWIKNLTWGLAGFSLTIVMTRVAIVIIPAQSDHVLTNHVSSSSKTSSQTIIIFTTVIILVETGRRSSSPPLMCRLSISSRCESGDRLLRLNNMVVAIVVVVVVRMMIKMKICDISSRRILLADDGLPHLSFWSSQSTTLPFASADQSTWTYFIQTRYKIQEQQWWKIQI